MCFLGPEFWGFGNQWLPTTASFSIEGAIFVSSMAPQIEKVNPMASMETSLMVSRKFPVSCHSVGYLFHIIPIRFFMFICIMSCWMVGFICEFHWIPSCCWTTAHLPCEIPHFWIPIWSPLCNPNHHLGQFHSIPLKNSYLMVNLREIMDNSHDMSDISMLFLPPSERTLSKRNAWKTNGCGNAMRSNARRQLMT